ncbi:hypothetical protein AVEN_133539-1 [Araneus ventricosus]|uniref:Uncharacterized protein n=1 Tax=Araneus ventricosus TaxID=182803 RepID=A0A4Y2WAB8_ARAVE|nr:hypothetical protein AVEN_133539-1 [Araneus ventricosus]
MCGPSLTLGNHYFQTQSATGLRPSVSDIREAVSVMSSFVNNSKQLDINKSASSQSVQELPQVNFDEKSCSSHSLKKSSSIDNSFFQSSSKIVSFLGESDLLRNSLHSSAIEETYQRNVTKKKISENKEKINVPKSYQALKPTSESKTTQTELHQFTTNSSHVKGLTQRV